MTSGKRKKATRRNSGGRRTVSTPPISLPSVDKDLQAVEMAMAVAPTVYSRLMASGERFGQ